MINVKKEIELECLQRVIKCGTKNRGLTKRIVNHLAGKDIFREDDERPDFVKYCPPQSKHQKGTVIGIEHFRVDQLSLKKYNDSIASTGIVHQKKVKAVFDKWHDVIKTDDEVPEGAIEDVINLVAKQLERVKQTSYNTFLASFKYTLNKHLESVDAYRKNLSNIARNNSKIELAFLIEIHTEFLNLFLTDRKGTSKNKNGFMPMFGDVVRLLETIDKKRIDYIVLCIGSTIHNDDVKVVAFRTGNIMKQLDNQNILVYEYVGDDYVLPEFQAMQMDTVITPNYAIDGEKIDFSFRLTEKILADEQKINLIFRAFRRAYYMQKHGINYASNLPVQMMMDVYSEYVIRWSEHTDEENQYEIKPVLSQLNQADIEEKIICSKKLGFPYR